MGSVIRVDKSLLLFFNPPAVLSIMPCAACGSVECTCQEICICPPISCRCMACYRMRERPCQHCGHPFLSDDIILGDVSRYDWCKCSKSESMYSLSELEASNTEQEASNAEQSSNIRVKYVPTDSLRINIQPRETSQDPNVSSTSGGQPSGSGQLKQTCALETSTDESVVEKESETSTDESLVEKESQEKIQSKVPSECVDDTSVSSSQSWSQSDFIMKRPPHHSNTGDATSSSPDPQSSHHSERMSVSIISSDDESKNSRNDSTDQNTELATSESNEGLLNISQTHSSPKNLGDRNKVTKAPEIFSPSGHKVAAEKANVPVPQIYLPFCNPSTRSPQQMPNYGPPPAVPSGSPKCYSPKTRVVYKSERYSPLTVNRPRTPEKPLFAEKFNVENWRDTVKSAEEISNANLDSSMNIDPETKVDNKGAIDSVDACVASNDGLEENKGLRRIKSLADLTCPDHVLETRAECDELSNLPLNDPMDSATDVDENLNFGVTETDIESFNAANIAEPSEDVEMNLVSKDPDAGS